LFESLFKVTSLDFIMVGVNNSLCV